MNKTKLRRAALLLLLMLFTTATAWAQGNVVVNITGDGTVTLTHDNQEETVTSGTSYFISDGNFTLTFTPASGNVLQSVSREIYMSSSGDITQELINNNGVYVYNGFVNMFPHTYNVIFAEEGAASLYSLSGQIYNASGATMTFSVGDQQNVTAAAEGAQVGITMSEPEENAYWDLSSQQVIITRDDATHFHFTMPANNVSIRAEQVITFFEIPTLYSVTDNSTGGYVRVRGNKYPDGFEEGETVTLIPIPDAGYEYVANSLSATNNSTGAAIALTDNGDATRSFQMPAASVTVTATFSTNNPGNESQEAITMTQDGSINMPTSGTTTVNIPNGVTKFYVYDDGGPSGNFSAGCNGQVLLIATEGKVLKVNGTVTGTTQATAIARLAVHDGSSTSATMLYQSVNGSVSNITSSGKQMLLHFYVIDNKIIGTAAGFSLTVEVIEPTTPHSITIADGITHGTVTADKTSAMAGETVTLTVTPAVGYELDQISGVTATSIGNNLYTFNMPDEDVTISASFHVSSLFGYYYNYIFDNYNPDGSAGKPYIISTADGWNLLCDCLAEENNTTWNRFSGKTVKLGVNIEVTRMAGSSGHDFCGTFDGGEHTLTFNYGISGTPADEDYIAPFRYVSNVENGPAANFKDLHVAGHIYTSAKYAAGLIAQHWGTVNIENCRVSTVIHSSVSGDGTHGGIEAVNVGELNITGCVFDGKLLTTGTTPTKNCGGFVGWHNGGTTSISNSLYAPAAIGDGETEVGPGVANENPSATFGRNAVNSITNSYYTRTLGTEQGKEAHSITAGENVTVALSGTATEYNVSGITAYKDGETQLKGLKYGDVFYAGNGDQVSLTLTNTAAAPLGYQYSGYTASAGTLDGTTLTMPDADVTVSPVLRSTDEPVGVSYVLADGTAQTAQAVALDGTESVLDKGWYFVGLPTVSFDNGLTFTGDVNLILADGTTMSVTNTNGGSCIFSQGKDLHIYGQTLGTGILNAQTQDNASSVISIHHGTLGIHGGNVSATVGGDDYNPYAIYMTRYFPNDALIIDGGTLTANGNNGDGIYIGGGNARINGGHVTATGDNGITVVGFKLEENTFPGILTLGGGTLTASSFRNDDWERLVGTITVADHLTYTDGTALYASTYDLYDLYNLTDVTTLRPALLDNADNGAAIAALATAATAHGYRLGSIALHGRTLYKDGDWNTLCLPFDVTLAGSPLDGATARKLTAASIEGTELNLTFSDPVDKLVAGTPYIIKWAEDTEHPTIVSPTFSGVTISSADNSYDNKATGDTRVRFLGTYAPIVWETKNKSILFLGTNNTLYYPQPSGGQNPRINAFRAYFQLGDGTNAPQITAFNLNFDDGEQTGIRSLSPDPSPSREGSAGAWYDMQGRKLDAKPTKPGLYINNGKKIVIK